MIKRILSVFVVLIIIASFAVPVFADGETAWTELLETTTVNNSGSNWFKYSSTATVSIPTPYSMRLTKIDMLLAYPTNQVPAKVEVFYGGTYYPLSIKPIDSNTARVYGTIQQNFYSDVRVRFTRSSTASTYLEILSCRVSQLVNQEVVANAQVYAENTYYATGTNIVVPGNSLEMTNQTQIRIDVMDWQKFDSITIWGSASDMGLSSVRATIGTVGLPFEMSYTQTIPTGETGNYEDRFSYTDYTTSSGGYGNTYGEIDLVPNYNAKILFCITIDLTGIDRTYSFGNDSYPLYVYLTGTYTQLYGYTFNCQYVNGSIIVPDKTEISWWNRFTQFMTNLFDPGNSEVDRFGDEAEQKADEMDNMNQQLDQIEKPPVEDINLGVDDLVPSGDVSVANGQFGLITQHPMVLTMTLISLTVALVAYILYGKR